MTPSLSRTAPAKLNLGLHVLRRRSDGYHDLETVFLPIAWADHLSARPAAGRSMTCSDAALPTDERNLCLKAAHLLAAHTGTPQGVHLHLDKQVPYGAGLGGGSSDAAATLRLLVDLWQCTVDEATLHALAAQLGSDVPFFLGTGAAYATGRGEVLTPLAYRCPYTFVVVMPPVSVSTPTAYGLLTPHAEDRPDLQRLVTGNDLQHWRRALVNDFEAPLLHRYPEIGVVHAALSNTEAGYVALTGSGAAVFGVFEDPAAAQHTADALAAEGYTVWCGTQTLMSR